MKTNPRARIILQAALAVALLPSLQLSQPTAQSVDQDGMQAEPMPTLTAHGFSSQMPVIRSLNGVNPVPMPRIKLPESPRRDSPSEQRAAATRWGAMFDGAKARLTP